MVAEMGFVMIGKKAKSEHICGLFATRGESAIDVPRIYRGALHTVLRNMPPLLWRYGSRHLLRWFVRKKNLRVKAEITLLQRSKTWSESEAREVQSPIIATFLPKGKKRRLVF